MRKLPVHHVVYAKHSLGGASRLDAPPERMPDGLVLPSTQQVHYALLKLK